MNFLVIGSSLASLLYLLATLAIVTRLFHPSGPNNKLVLVLALLAIIVHAATDAFLFFSKDIINFSLPNVISLVTLIIAVIVTAASLRFKVPLLLPVVYGFAGLWQGLMIVLPPIESIPLKVEKVILLSHISFALIAYSILVIATLFAFQVTYINLKLKSKNLAAVAHLPPLMQVEKQLFLILSVGTIMLFISQIIGFTFLDGLLAKEKAHKTVLSLIAFAIYALILWGHYIKGWRGHRVLVPMLSASILLTLAYFGSRFVKEYLI